MSSNSLDGVTDTTGVESTSTVLRPPKPRRWWTIFDEYEYRGLWSSEGKRNFKDWISWFDKNDTREEKILLIKLDIIVAFYSLVCYWVKMLDASNLNNAYVSGMQEDLKLGGNDLVHLTSIYFIGCVIFQLPCVYIFPKLPMNLVLPTMDIGWGLFTLAQYKATSYHQLLGFRFMVGLFEAGSFPAIQYVLGSWYKHNELARRGSIFYIGQYLGSMTSGLLQASIYRTLNGHNGIAGWRWMFIINTVITIPVGLLGYLLWPGTPEKCYSIFLTAKEKELARQRVKDNGNKKGEFISLVLIKKVLTSWHFWVLVPWAIFLNNSQASQQAGYILWLKSLNRFSTPRINDLSALSPGLGIVYMCIFSIAADVFRSRFFFLILPETINLIALSLLSAWNITESAKWFAMLMQHMATCITPILYSWTNDILRDDDNYRAIILVLMNAISQSTLAWIPLLVWKTSEGPRFFKGYTYTAVCAAFMLIIAVLVLYLYKRDEKTMYLQAVQNSGQESKDSIEKQVARVSVREGSSEPEESV